MPISLRRTLYQAWVSLLLFGIICMGTFRVLQDPQDKLLERGVREIDSRQVTKSILELPTTSSLSEHVLFFNRVPKAGSEMLVLLLQWLQGSNGFRHVRLPNGDKRRLTDAEQEEVVDQVTRIMKNEAVPLSFDRHVYFINFTRFDKQSPVYLNLVRDPVDKAVSRFYYGRVTPNPRNPDIKYAPKRPQKRTITFGTFEDCVSHQKPDCHFMDGKPYDLAIPYFCGHDKRCMLLNNYWALQRAKKNVEKYYPVVGVLEELNATLIVLENRLPRFFKNVHEIYYEELMQPHKNANRRKPRQIDEEVREKLKNKLVTEYEFYSWLRARLVNQQNEIS